MALQITEYSRPSGPRHRHRQAAPGARGAGPRGADRAGAGRAPVAAGDGRAAAEGPRDRAAQAELELKGLEEEEAPGIAPPLRGADHRAPGAAGPGAEIASLDRHRVRLDESLLKRMDEIEAARKQARWRRPPSMRRRSPPEDHPPPLREGRGADRNGPGRAFAPRGRPGEGARSGSPPPLRGDPPAATTPRRRPDRERRLRRFAA